MKHEFTQPITTGDVIHHYSNSRVNGMVARCSDAQAIMLATQIYEQRMAGMPTHFLEQQLDNEMSRMFICTRILNGRHYAHVKK